METMRYPWTITASAVSMLLLVSMMAALMDPANRVNEVTLVLAAALLGGIVWGGYRIDKMRAKRTP